MAVPTLAPLASFFGDAVNLDVVLVCAVGAAIGTVFCLAVEKLFRMKKAENMRAFVVGSSSAVAITLYYHKHDFLPTILAVLFGAALGVFSIILLWRLIRWLTKSPEE
jgi:uncharacterized membrane protein YfcA